MKQKIKQATIKYFKFSFGYNEDFLEGELEGSKKFV